jgi:hypothetical protein
MTEVRDRADAGAVFVARAALKDRSEQVVVLSHAYTGALR